MIKNILVIALLLGFTFSAFSLDDVKYIEVKKVNSRDWVYLFNTTAQMIGYFEIDGTAIKDYWMSLVLTNNNNNSSTDLMVTPWGGEITYMKLFR